METYSSMVDIPDVNTGIILSVNSSKIVKTQTVGRCIRFAPGKKAELFTLIIAGTQEFG
jgi:superfamily II DNA or RNA helicase